MPDKVNFKRKEYKQENIDKKTHEFIELRKAQAHES